MRPIALRTFGSMRCVAAVLVTVTLGGVAGANGPAPAARIAGQSVKAAAPRSGFIGTVTDEKVAIHAANLSSRSTMTAMSLNLHGVAVGAGFTDGAIAIGGIARQLQQKSVKEVLKDPVTETLGSIGLTGVGNALNAAGFPGAAEVSLTGAALLGGHGLKSALSASLGSREKRPLGQRLREIARNPVKATRNGIRALRDPRTGLAGANAFMKLSLMASTAGFHKTSAGFAAVGTVMGMLPIASQIRGGSVTEVAHSVGNLVTNPMNITTSALILTDLGQAAGQMHHPLASSLLLTAAVSSSAVGAVKAVHAHRAAARLASE